MSLNIKKFAQEVRVNDILTVQSLDVSRTGDTIDSGYGAIYTTSSNGLANFYFHTGDTVYDILEVVDFKNRVTTITGITNDTQATTLIYDSQDGLYKQITINNLLSGFTGNYVDVAGDTMTGRLNISTGGLGVTGGTNLDSLSFYSGGTIDNISNTLTYNGSGTTTVVSENGIITHLEDMNSKRGVFTGFENYDDVFFSINEGTNTVTLSATGGTTSFNVYYQGQKITIDTSVSFQFESNSGSSNQPHHFFYIKPDGTMDELINPTEDQIFDLIQGNAYGVYCAYVYWNSTQGRAVNFSVETHGIRRNSRFHLQNHLTEGTKHESGGELSNWGTTTDVSDQQPYLSNSAYWDEDIRFVTNGRSDSNFSQSLNPIDAPMFFKSGDTWNILDQTTMDSYIFYTETNIIRYNPIDSASTGGTLQTVPQNGSGFTYTYIAETSDPRHPIVLIMGQHSASTAVDAENSALDNFANLDLQGLPAQELKIIWIVIAQSVIGNGDYAIVTVNDIRDNKFNVLTGNVPGDSSLAQDISTNTINFGNVLSAADDNVQKALDTIDDNVYKKSDTYSKTEVNNNFLSGDTTLGELFNVAIAVDSANEGDVLSFSGGTWTNIESIDLSSITYTKSEADSRFVNITGDTMTGDLTLNSGLTLGAVRVDGITVGGSLSDDETNLITESVAYDLNVAIGNNSTAISQNTISIGNNSTSIANNANSISELSGDTYTNLNLKYDKAGGNITGNVVITGGTLQLTYGDTTVDGIASMTGLTTDATKTLLTEDAIVNYVGDVVSAGVTASNGLTKTGADIQLGGTLTKNTTINGASSGLTFSSMGNFSVISTIINLTGKTYLNGLTSGNVSSFIGISGLTNELVTRTSSQYRTDLDVYSTNETDSAISTAIGLLSFYTQSQLDGGQLNTLYYTETEADNKFVDIAGDTMTGALVINNDLTVTGSTSTKGLTNTGAFTNIGTVTITGDLYVSGTTTTVNTTQLNVADNIITVNSGETNTGVTNQAAGLKIDRGAATPYYFVFDELSDTFRIGQSTATETPEIVISGDTQAVATRADSMTEWGFGVWKPGTEPDGYKFVSFAALTYNTGSSTLQSTNISATGTITSNIFSGNTLSVTTLNVAGDLDVNGGITGSTIYSEGWLRADGALTVIGTSLLSGSTTFKDTVTMESTLGVTGLITATDIDATGGITGATMYSEGWLRVDGDIDAQSNVTIGGTLDVTDSTTLNSTLDVTGVTTLWGATTIESNLTLNGNLLFDSATITGITTNMLTETATNNAFATTLAITEYVSNQIGSVLYFKTITGDTGSYTATSVSGDTMAFVGGDGISTEISGNILTITNTTVDTQTLSVDSGVTGQTISVGNTTDHKTAIIDYYISTTSGEFQEGQIRLLVSGATLNWIRDYQGDEIDAFDDNDLAVISGGSFIVKLDNNETNTVTMKYIFRNVSA